MTDNEKHAAFSVLSDFEEPVRNATTVAGMLDDEIDKYCQACGTAVSSERIYYLIGRVVREIDAIDDVLRVGFSRAQ